MVNGQVVRVIPTSPLARALDLPPEMLGAVLCCYRLNSRIGGAVERVDVRLANSETIWGAAADQFEVVETQQRPDA